VLWRALQDEELRLLLEKKPHPVCYDGFEPSGRMHIAQGIMKAINVRVVGSHMSAGRSMIMLSCVVSAGEQADAVGLRV
jgi:tyrosyl-tRNA synthetase